MSAINGDKARFHRKRKAGIARRARNRERLQNAHQGNTGTRGPSRKTGHRSKSASLSGGSAADA